MRKPSFLALALALASCGDEPATTATRTPAAVQVQ